MPSRGFFSRGSSSSQSELRDPQIHHPVKVHPLHYPPPIVHHQSSRPPQHHKSGGWWMPPWLQKGDTSSLPPRTHLHSPSTPPTPTHAPNMGPISLPPDGIVMRRSNQTVFSSDRDISIVSGGGGGGNKYYNGRPLSEYDARAYSNGGGGGRGHPFTPTPAPYQSHHHHHHQEMINQANGPQSLPSTWPRPPPKDLIINHNNHRNHNNNKNMYSRINDSSNDIHHNHRHSPLVAHQSMPYDKNTLQRYHLEQLVSFAYNLLDIEIFRKYALLQSQLRFGF